MRFPSLALVFHFLRFKLQGERFRNMRTLEQQVLTLVRRAGILRAKELDKHHLPRMCLRRLERKGLIQRISRGLYVPAGSEPVSHQALAEATKLLRGGIVCLLSA